MNQLEKRPWVGEKLQGRNVAGAQGGGTSGALRGEGDNSREQ